MERVVRNKGRRQKAKGWKKREVTREAEAGGFDVRVKDLKDESRKCIVVLGLGNVVCIK